MKKNILLLVLLLLCSGCTLFESSDEEKEKYCEANIIKLIGYDREILEQKLVEYGEKAMKSYNEPTLSPDAKQFSQIFTIDFLDEKLHYDFSMFVNTRTDKPCDPKKTKIEVIAKIDGDNRTYEYVPYLYCD